MTLDELKILTDGMDNLEIRIGMAGQVLSTVPVNIVTIVHDEAGEPRKHYIVLMHG